MSDVAARDIPRTARTDSVRGCELVTWIAEARKLVKHSQCRLAAIMAADVVGYSRLMEEDEAGTLAALKARRRCILRPLVAEYRGRVFKLAGDCALVEFASAVEAIVCAIDLQARMTEANAGLTEDRRIVLRIGINLGDVMVEGTDLYGDGINVAARLETLAEPGSICVSAAVQDQVARRLPLAFEDLGEQALRNIARRVRAYRVAVKLPHGSTTATPGPQASAISIAVAPFGQEFFSSA
jgi:adenylate cyclase